MFNFHTHSNFCDGNDSPEAYIKEALNKNFKAIGFSSHTPTPIPLDWTLKEENISGYINTIKTLKKKYEGKIEVYLGLEFDFYEKKEWQKTYFTYKSLVDYAIGSVHFLYDVKQDRLYIIDGNIQSYISALKEIFNENTIAFVGEYYRLIRKMIIEYKPDIIAHIDLIKKNNKDEIFFKESEVWYEKLILETLDTVAKSSSILEVNTGGISRGAISDFYPSERFFKECYKRKIPIIINSDAHTPKNIDAYFKEAKKSLKKAGYITQKVLFGNKWVEIEI